jgi:hypothetical protein
LFSPEKNAPMLRTLSCRFSPVRKSAPKPARSPPQAQQRRILSQAPMRAKLLHAHLDLALQLARRQHPPSLRSHRRPRSIQEAARPTTTPQAGSEKPQASVSSSVLRLFGLLELSIFRRLERVDVRITSAAASEISSCTGSSLL